MPAGLPTHPVTDGEVTLRPPADRDAPLLLEACQDPEIPRWTTVPSPYTEAHARAWPAEARAQAEAGTALNLLAVDAQDRLLGAVGLPRVDRARSVGEVGYWMAPWARGRGLCARAVRLLREHALDPGGLGLARLELLAHPDNRASRAVAERAGFTATGELRGCAPSCSPDAPHVVYAWPPPGRSAV